MGAVVFAGVLVLSLLLAGAFVAYVWQAGQPATVAGWTVIGPKCTTALILSTTIGRNRQLELWVLKGGVAGIQGRMWSRPRTGYLSYVILARSAGYRVVRGRRMWRWGGFTIVAQ